MVSKKETHTQTTKTLSLRRTSSWSLRTLWQEQAFPRRHQASEGKERQRKDLCALEGNRDRLKDRSQIGDYTSMKANPY